MNVETSSSDGLLRIALNRPEKRNALNIATCRQLLEALDSAGSDPAIRVILLSGNGPAFCAGMDLSEVLNADQNELATLHERLFTTIRRARKPIVAAVQGAALAAGTGLAANAHVVVAASDARFGLTEIRIGLWPFIVFRAVAAAIGERRATELSLSGRHISAAEALSFGLIAEISDEPLVRAEAIASSLASFSPEAISSGLESVEGTRNMDWAQAAPAIADARTRVMTGSGFEEGVRAFLGRPRTHQK